MSSPADLAAYLRDLGGLAHVGQNFVVPGQSVRGMIQPGNLNLNNRPVVHNKDGSISTVKSTSFGDGGRETLVPQVVGRRVVGPLAAWQHFLNTGQNLGSFTGPDAANAYALALHLAQAQEYGGRR